MASLLIISSARQLFCGIKFCLPSTQKIMKNKVFLFLCFHAFLAGGSIIYIILASIFMHSVSGFSYFRGLARGVLSLYKTINRGKEFSLASNTLSYS